MATANGLVGEKPRQGVCGIHVGGATKTIARKLIQQKHQRKAAFRTLQPVIQFAPCCREMGIAETVVEMTVEGGILVEPLVRPGLLPEIDDIGGKRGCVVFHLLFPVNNAAAG
ncbi:hypothetical protein D3C78_1402220 [compost metagenome]